MPRGLKRLLAGHEVATVQERGWSSLENGALLELPSAEFEVLVTADQNIPHLGLVRRRSVRAQPPRARRLVEESELGSLRRVHPDADLRKDN